ncbi:MAG: EAL domain-containing protein, partial [Hyphomicrobiaceae bacterium]|nr:EAL domain-containing protein [Hyphomicrobiaceae bacterium]
FVRNLAENTENQLFIRNLLSLARAFNLVTVAECVETLEDAKILEREGVDQLQGYYFGRPEVDPAWRVGHLAPPLGIERRRAEGAPPDGNERRRAAR